MIRRVLVKHLHSQIIVPLIAAAAIFALIATLVALQVINGLVGRWIDGNAADAARLIMARIDHRSDVTHSSLELIATDPRVLDAVAGSDYSALHERLSFASRALAVDSLMVLDGDGGIVLSVGGVTPSSGERPFDLGMAEAAERSADGPLVARLGEQHAVAQVVPLLGPGDSAWALAAANIMDDEWLADLNDGVRAGFVLMDGQGRPVARSAAAALGGANLTRSLSAETLDAAARAAEDADDAEGVARGLRVRVDDAEYRVVAQSIEMAGDHEASPVYIASIMDTSLAREARVTTAYLIAMWFVLGLASLLVLNWYVARTVSRPLGALSASVARVASGDFAVRAEAPGHNELSELADDLNRMTESLRDRSDSLTKKVLELATLYEMSRSLGSTLELDTLLDSVLDSAMRIFDVEVGYVTIVERETGGLEVATWRGVDLSRADATSVRSSMSEWVIREGRPLIFNPTPDGSEPRGEAHGDTVSGAVAALCVPLLSADGTIGAITVGTRDATRRFTSDDVRLLATIANHVTIAVGNIALFSSVQEAYLATVRALAAAVDAKDPYTRGHSDGVARYALMIGEELGLSAEQMVALEMAAYLHDIGKIGISEDILLKPGKLTDAEMSQMRHHPLIGANILKPVAFPWPIAPVVRHHHEHFDGAGYPAGLRNEEIPVLARVLTVADAFEAMVADRPYRRGRSQQEAVLELRRCSGTQFDPRIVDAFVSVLERAEAMIPDSAATDDLSDPAEEQAVLVALCDGMFASFRRLGGPRLASNLERTVNEAFAELELPFSLHGGHLSADGEESLDDEALVERLSQAIQVISASIEGASGAGLADHFLSEALAGLPERMRVCAARLGVASAS